MRVLPLAFILLLHLFFGCASQQDAFRVSDSGIIHFPVKNCPAEELNSSVEGGDRLIGIRFQNEGAWVYGLLRIPSNASGNSKVPALVLLHGAGVDKEFEQKLARFLSSRGYASLSIDLRGSGETGGLVASGEEELEDFASGKPPQSHLMVSDALCAFSILSSSSEVDASRVAFAGESLGGRLAIIAAALEPRAKGVVGISTSGYGLPSHQNETIQRFMRSIDPDNYIPLISPRRAVLIHSTEDQTVSYSAAIETYQRAREPRRLAAVSCQTHGYCAEMNSVLETELQKIFA